MEYNFKEIEKKWMVRFEQVKPFCCDFNSKKPKYYSLEMFPYPSGSLHMGHVRNYTLGDVVARYKRLRGYNVLHPIGWDAFGLPAENAAIDKKIHPAKWTFSNIDEMRSQLKLLGLSYHWDDEICTAKPDYYKWGQWFFIKFFEKGLVYRKKAVVNWDPVDKTVLAKEQVVEGRAWRSGALVEKREIEQWYFKVSDYAEELLTGLDKLEGWPEKVKIMQKNWIGKSVGAQVNFIYQSKHGKRDFPIFTTRPDTLYGATFMAIAFDRGDLFDYVTEEKKVEVAKFVETCKLINQNENYEKEGVFTGITLENPVNGEALPLYVANFVLAEYGTGAIMSVPAHDARDFDFAKKYNLLIKSVIQPKGKGSGDEANLNGNTIEEVYSGDGVMVNSGFLNGHSTREAIKLMIDRLEKEGWGEKKVNYKLKDWLISRQRYWGNPIPMLRKKRGDGYEYRAVDLDQLPVKLPEDVEFKPGNNALSLSEHPSFQTVEVEGETWERETDTMDTFTCSSWYYLRYMDPKNEELPFDKSRGDNFLSVDQYIGGVEHACMHLLYSRFFHKAVRDLGLVASDEPFENLLTQGMVVSPSYYSAKDKKYFTPEQVEKGDLGNNLESSLEVKVEKMSKSKNNGVNPVKMVEKYGADSVRLFALFAAPAEKDLAWNEKGIEGCQRFLLKVVRWGNQLASWEVNFTEELKSNSESHSDNLPEGFMEEFHRTIQKVEQDLERLHFNTAIAKFMSWVNYLSVVKIENKKSLVVAWEVFEKLLILLSPLAPFLAEELYQTLIVEKTQTASSKDGKLVSELEWPKWDEKFLKNKIEVLIIQVNGKVRGKIEVEAGKNKDEVLSYARSHENVAKWLENGVVKEIFIPGRLINFVVE